MIVTSPQGFGGRSPPNKKRRGGVMNGSAQVWVASGRFSCGPFGLTLFSIADVLDNQWLLHDKWEAGSQDAAPLLVWCLSQNGHMCKSSCAQQDAAEKAAAGLAYMRLRGLGCDTFTGNSTAGIEAGFLYESTGCALRPWHIYTHP